MVCNFQIFLLFQREMTGNQSDQGRLTLGIKPWNSKRNFTTTNTSQGDEESRLHMRST